MKIVEKFEERKILLFEELRIGDCFKWAENGHSYLMKLSSKSLMNLEGSTIHDWPHGKERVVRYKTELHISPDSPDEEDLT